MILFTIHIRRASEHVNMRLLLSSLCLLLWGSLWSAVSAKSAVGDRILVVMEDQAQTGDYAQLWKDLESMPMTRLEYCLDTDCSDSKRLQT